MKRALLALCALMLAATAHAQGAFDTAATGGAVTATSQTVSYTMSASAGGCMMIAALGDATSDILTTATFSGVSATLVNKQNANPGAVYWQNIWMLAAPASGTHNVVVSAGSSIHIETYIASWTGVSATKCQQVSSQQSGSGDPFNSTLTTLSGNSWTAAFINSSVGVVVGSGSTLRTSDTSPTFTAGIVDSNGVVALGSVTLAVAGAGGTKQSGMVAFAPPGTNRRGLLGLGR